MKGLISCGTDQVNKYSTVSIVGMGNIAYKYDFSNSNQEITPRVATHSSAINKTKTLRLIECFDNQIRAADQAEEALGIRCFCDWDEYLANVNADIYVIATPSSIRFRIIKTLLEKKRPRLIIIEKPLATTLEEAQQIYELSINQNSTRFFVNYFRPCLDEFIGLRAKIRQNEFGRLRHIHAMYGKGQLLNGSHLLDLLLFLTDSKQIVNYEKLATLTSSVYGDSESLLSFTLGKIQVIFAGLGSPNTRVFELSMYFDRALVRVNHQSGDLVIYPLESDKPDWDTHYEYRPIPQQVIKSNNSNSMEQVYSRLVEELNNPNSELFNLERPVECVRVLG